MERSSTGQNISARDLQYWFSEIISQPDEEVLASSEVEAHILPSDRLSSSQRMALYHRQYWLRLTDVMQKNFPALTLFLGEAAFNQEIVIPYLSEAPPSHWALCRLGEDLPDWIARNYPQEDLSFVFDLSRIDLAAQRAFWMEEHPPLQQFDGALSLQPHLSLLALKADLVSYREAILTKTSPLPELVFEDCYFVIFRGLDHWVKWERLSEAQYKMLCHFQSKASLQEACAVLEGYDVEAELPFWFQKWVYLKWFC